ncbi:glutamine amidotransferase-related protein [Flammeovirga aprica]|uniref:C26 family cysteine hydrolase domain-containing family n=1 Tax=Flammeovirga aprica JL-4 TaxID=694437 RepID=A0A7X9RS31_9BACT|nr:gamma-glutamyl-gamma-aminobutyrate hydrolase family protein [Flammeovirga aprica]NME68508.1 C26 family cysteine hydrolase domain-containing family [Flammeovirga aprica JL-4]
MDLKHLIVNCGSVKTKHFGEILEQDKLEYSIVNIDKLTDEHLKNADKIIISGAPILLTEVDPKPYLKQFEILKTLSTPVLGVCFGHQILGILEGGQIKRTEEARSLETIHQCGPSPLFDSIPQDSSFAEDHCESVTLSENFKLLAFSDSCENEAMQHKHLNWWGVQFHPEVSEEYGTLLMKNWLNLCSSTNK